MACKKNIPTIPFMKSLCTEGWWCSCSTFMNFPGPAFNGRVELCTGMTLDKSKGQGRDQNFVPSFMVKAA